MARGSVAVLYSSPELYCKTLIRLTVGSIASQVFRGSSRVSARGRVHRGFSPCELF